MTVMDNSGARLNRRQLGYCEEELLGILSRLPSPSDSPNMPVAMATNCGLIVGQLLASGHPVVPVHPKARPEPTGQTTFGLQALIRRWIDHLEARIAALDQLAALFDAPSPRSETVFANLISHIAPHVLDRYQIRVSDTKLTVGRLQARCWRNGHSGKKQCCELIKRLMAYPC
ncbi:hypothetical protein AB0N62_45430 [Streptomyces sp. NPDC093982]|uniref:hypothetical protein n=1 Tax=Streptomyces sp. NPDC093982 TaxID=3155077 RepID=UPI003445FAAE